MCIPWCSIPWCVYLDVYTLMCIPWCSIPWCSIPWCSIPWCVYLDVYGGKISSTCFWNSNPINIVSMTTVTMATHGTGDYWSIAFDHLHYRCTCTLSITSTTQYHLIMQYVMVTYVCIASAVSYINGSCCSRYCNSYIPRSTYCIRYTSLGRHIV